MAGGKRGGLAGYFTTDEKHDYHWYREDAPVELRQTAWLAEKAIDFMKERKDSDKPWLLSVNCYDPHPPYDAPLHLVNKYLDRKLPDPIYSDGDLELNDKLKDFFSRARHIRWMIRREGTKHLIME